MANTLPDGSRPMDIDGYRNTHDYTMWQPKSRVMLCNVPWDGTYRDIVRFEDEAARDRYFASLEDKSETVVLTRQTMVRFGEPIKLAMPFDMACRYNYVCVSYGRPGNERTWYYFIQDVKWAAGGVTSLYLMLDVWTSFQFDVKFGRCYVDHGHIAIAAKKKSLIDKRNKLEILEGLDVGAQYNINSAVSKSIMGTDSPSNSDHSYSVLISSTVSLEADWPDAKNADNLRTAGGSLFELFPTGTSVYVIPDGSRLPEFMNKISGYPLVSQGIVNITFVPYESEFNTGGTWITSNGLPEGLIKYPVGGRVQDGLEKEFFRVPSFRSRFDIPPRYSMLADKLTMFPYSEIECTLQNGQVLIIKPETVNSEDLVFHRIMFLAQPSPRLVFFPMYVNTTQDPNNVLNSWKTTSRPDEYLNNALVLDNLPTTNIVNNQSLAYMTSNRRSIAWSYQSLDWSQQKAQLGIQQSQATTAQGNRFRQQNTNLQNAQAGERTLYRNVETGVGAATNGVGQLLSGSVGGAIGNAVNTTESIAFNSINNSQNMRFNQQGTNLANRQATEANDLNVMYAQQAMNGDYRNQLAGLNAKLQDAQLMEPSVSGQIGGDNFNFATDNSFLIVRFKTLPQSAMANIGEYFLRYGYSVQRFVTPPQNLQVMTRATYWKMSETFLSSSKCPEPYRMTIRGIFEKGVTVYRNPEDIGTLDFANQQPLQGIEY